VQRLHNKIMATNLYEYYTGQGQNLPSVQERAVIYEQKGLGKASDYKGTSSQNQQLLGALNPNSMQGNKPTTSPSVITSEQAQGAVNNATQGIADLTKQPKQPKTSTTYQEQLEDIAPEYESLETDFLKEINQIRKGVIKYTADEQAQLDYITQSIANARNAQEKFNRQSEKGTRLLSVGEFAPVRQMSALNQTIQSGINELKNIDMEGASKLGEARQAIRDRRFDEIVKTYGELNSMLDRRSKVIQQLRDNAMESEKFAYQKETDARDFDLKMQKLKSDLSTDALQREKLRLELSGGSAKDLKNLSGDAAKVLSISSTLPKDIQRIQEIMSEIGYEKAVLAYKTGTNRELVKLIDNAADKVGRLRSGGAINKEEEKRFKSQFVSTSDLFWGNQEEAFTNLQRITDESNNVARYMDPDGKYRALLDLDVDDGGDPLEIGSSETSENNPLGI